MKCIKVNLPKELESVKIELFSDLHIGSKKCNYNAIQERIQKVLDNENTYCVILGDIINNSIKTSVGDVYEEELTPLQQIQKAVSMFMPIKDKILCVTAGNHERRTMKQDGIDLCYFFSKELGVADRYDYCACALFLRLGYNASRGKKDFRQICYSFYITHGDGQGGRTVGGKANGLARRGQIIDTDIVITGHTHQAITFREAFYRVDAQNSLVTKQEQLFINASATLDYEQYAELYGMKPGSIISPVIVLNGRKKFANVII